jgi:hypothetical protein
MLTMVSLMNSFLTSRRDIKPSVNGASFVRSMVSFRAFFWGGGLTGSVNEARVVISFLIASVLVESSLSRWRFDDGSVSMLS